jgi:RimJ/RimL family protein N-acetyltransferase
MTRTTLPLLPPTPPTLRTPRLLLRPFSPADLPYYIILRRQPEVMKWTSIGRCDETVSQTEEWMARFLPSKDPKTFNFSVEELEMPGTVIGAAGFFLFDGKQPEIGYMFRKEMWGRGYATEAVKAVLEAYWGLQRREVDLQIEGNGGEQRDVGEYKASIEAKHAAGFRVETLLAVTEAANTGSRRVLEKFRFVKAREFQDAGGAECVDYILLRPGS